MRDGTSKVEGIPNHCKRKEKGREGKRGPNGTLKEEGLCEKCTGDPANHIRTK